MRPWAGLEYHRQANQKYVPKGIPDSQVNVNYTDPVTTDSVHIIIWPKFDLSVLENISYQGGEKTMLNINGSPATLIEKNWGRVWTRVILMQAGRSSLSIEASDKQTLLDAAQRLAKLN